MSALYLYNALYLYKKYNVCIIFNADNSEVMPMFFLKTSCLPKIIPNYMNLKNKPVGRFYIFENFRIT